MAGLFLSFEGTEGAGKTTQIDRLEARLVRAGRPVLRVREPGGTEIGERIRAVLLDRDHGEMAPWTELCLYVASRAQLMRERIVPALDAGAIVLCDRFGDASVAYQGGGRGLGPRRVARLNSWATEERRPDRTYLFDLDPRIGLERIRAGRGAASFDRLESEAIAFHRSVRRAYLALARKDPDRILRLDASLDPDRIESLIAADLDPRLPR